MGLARKVSIWHLDKYILPITKVFDDTTKISTNMTSSATQPPWAGEMHKFKIRTRVTPIIVKRIMRVHKHTDYWSTETVITYQNRLVIDGVEYALVSQNFDSTGVDYACENWTPTTYTTEVEIRLPEGDHEVIEQGRSAWVSGGAGDATPDYNELCSDLLEIREKWEQ